jgi:6-phosphogluconolactonase (cycloisomerase 2 family)
LLLTACNGGTPGGGAGPTIQYPRFAYLANPNENLTSVYQVLAPSGQLKPLGYAPIQAMAVRVAGDWMVVVGSGSSLIFKIDAASGFPAAAPTTSLPLCPFPVFVSKDGNYIFCVSGSTPKAHVFGLDQQSGNVRELGSASISGTSLIAVDPPLRFMLAPDPAKPGLIPIKLNLGAASNQVVPGAPWALPGPLTFVAMAPSGRFAYVGVENVDSASEALKTMSLGSQSAKIDALASSFDGKRMFALQDDFGTQGGIVAQFGIDIMSGTFVSKRDEFPMDTAQPVAACADANGQWFYVANGLGPVVSLYDLDPPSGDLITVSIPGGPGQPLTPRQIQARKTFTVKAGGSLSDMKIIDTRY